jgi:hypothetical protein
MRKGLKAVYGQSLQKEAVAKDELEAIGRCSVDFLVYAILAQTSWSSRRR